MVDVKKVVVTPKLAVQQVDIILPTHKKQKPTGFPGKVTRFISA